MAPKPDFVAQKMVVKSYGLRDLGMLRVSAGFRIRFSQHSHMKSRETSPVFL